MIDGYPGGDPPPPPSGEGLGVSSERATCHGSESHVTVLDPVMLLSYGP